MNNFEIESITPTFSLDFYTPVTKKDGNYHFQYGNHHFSFANIAVNDKLKTIPKTKLPDHFIARNASSKLSLEDNDGLFLGYPGEITCKLNPGVYSSTTKGFQTTFYDNDVKFVVDTNLGIKGFSTSMVVIHENEQFVKLF